MSKIFSRGLGVPLWHDGGDVSLNLPEAFLMEDVGSPSLRHTIFTESQNIWDWKGRLL